MPLKPEVESWLKSLPLSDAVREGLQKELEDEQKQIKVRETILARSDYSRHMDALREEKEKLEKEVADAKSKAENMLKANVKWREDNQAVLDQTLTSKAEQEKQLKAYEAKIKLLVDQGYIDPNDPSFTVKTPVVDTPKPDAKYLTEKDLAAIMARKEQEMALAMANFGDLADEHFRLFGTHLKRQDLVKEVLDKNVSLEQAWENLFKVSDKRKELSEKEINDKIAAARAEERTKVLSEIAVSPGTSVRGEGLDDGVNKHILNLVKPQAGSGGVSDAVRLAKESWAKGEFREK